MYLSGLRWNRCPPNHYFIMLVFSSRYLPHSLLPQSAVSSSLTSSCRCFIECTLQNLTSSICCFRTGTFLICHSPSWCFLIPYFIVLMFPSTCLPNLYFIMWVFPYIGTFLTPYFISLLFPWIPYKPLLHQSAISSSLTSSYWCFRACAFQTLTSSC